MHFRAPRLADAVDAALEHVLTERARRDPRRMSHDEMIDLADRIRTRWRQPLDDHEYLAWRDELLLHEHAPAAEAIDQLSARTPHRRPPVAEFTETVHTITNPTRLSPAQIALNTASIERIRNMRADRVHQGATPT
jgi:hypothetical protein